jgi:hypothetical protein
MIAPGDDDGGGGGVQEEEGKGTSSALPSPPAPLMFSLSRPCRCARRLTLRKAPLFFSAFPMFVLSLSW